jgi:hypothetical protein
MKTVVAILLNILLALISIALISVFSYMVHITPTEYKYKQGSCLLDGVNTAEYRCCKLDCYDDCGFNANNLPTCNYVKSNLIDGQCSDGYHCCKHGCDTCTRKKGNKTETYSCNCRCKVSTPDQLCRNRCGNCHTQIATYRLSLSSLETNFTKTCGINDIEKVNINKFGITTQFGLNATVTGPNGIIDCYYKCKDNNTIEVVRYNEAIFNPNMVGYGFGIAFGIVGIIVTITIFVCVIEPSNSVIVKSSNPAISEPSKPAVVEQQRTDHTGRELPLNGTVEMTEQ